MTASVRVELDRWNERGSIRAEKLEDGSQTTLGLQMDGNKKIVFNRTILLGNYGFRVFVTEHHGTTFLVRASMATGTNRRRKLTGTTLRERPVTPVIDSYGDPHWTLDRTGVFAKFPEKWDDYWANIFIKETLDLLRSPEIPKHYEIHRDHDYEE
jgi:hypothetical protein